MTLAIGIARPKPLATRDGLFLMTINLTIENLTELPTGGPTRFRSQDRSFEIGRENCDWVLPDPNMFISGRHCEVRHESGSYWLHDLSRNGTFVNGATQRVKSPYQLNDGDRLQIGHYLVSVAISADAGVQQSQAPWGPENVWGTDAPLSPRPVQPASFDPLGAVPVRPLDDFSFPFENAPAAAPAQPVAQPFQPQATPRPSPAPAPMGAAQSGDAEALLRAIAVGAGVSPDIFMQRDPSDVAAEIGLVLRTAVEELALLLKARASAKVLARSNSRTMIGAVDNNPLKFVPRPEEVLEIMFTRRRAGYLDAKHSIDEAFRDLKTHEFATFAAMQTALSRLLEDLSPEAIEKKVPASAFASRKSRAWDTFVATWEAKEKPHENGMLDVFLTYFADAYAKASKPK
ncbi:MULTISPECIES: type VI secretion system-associated FHA domain protein TagH [unclassified Mesorhizobium]|uniref:type VI secretion system-associated FHA domain protein TagH n=1 Tax=unclassified Mesorhizobium TaxID=325217 RepID=UPI0030153EBF